MLAGQVLIEEAGGRVSDYTGMRIATADRTDVITSNGAVHDALIPVLVTRSL
jgi:fructose-1,6-bisphosphatase/inositol monophosphatase family enzyme